MALPVELEIFIKDYTKNAMESIKKGISETEDDTVRLISMLKKLRAEKAQIVKANKKAGQSYAEEAAEVQALTGKINDLNNTLKEIKKAKEEASKTSIDIDTETVERKTNNLRMQFSQVARELPSLAMGPQMFILAISNNLPMLADAIADVRKQNELLAASGKKAVPVWRQLLSACVSWQTILVALISLGVVYSRDIADWVKGLTSARDGAESFAEAQERVAKAFRESDTGLGEHIVRVRSLADRWKELGDSMQEKQKFIKDNREELDRLGVSVENVADVENVLVGNTSAYIESMTLRAQAASAFKMAEDEAEKALRKRLEAEKEEKEGPSFGDRLKSFVTGAMLNTRPNVNMEAPTPEEFFTSRIEGIREEQKAAEESAKQLTNVYTDLQEQADALMKKAGFRNYDRDHGTASSGPADYAKKLEEARLRAERETERLRIQIRQEGYDRRRALAKQEYEETVADISRQQQETVAEMDAARKKGDAVPQSQYDSVAAESDRARVLAKEKLNLQLQQIDKEYNEQAAQDLIDYNRQYGTYAEKRLAITQDYARKMAKAQTDGERQALRQEYDKETASLDFDRFKDEMDWEKIFGDLDRVSTETLESLREKMKEYLEGIGEEISPESFAEVMDAFQAMDAQLADRSPFETMKRGYKDYISAMNEVRDAQKLVESTQGLGLIVAEEYDKATGKLTYRLITQAEAEKRLRDAQDKRYSAQKSLTQAVNSIGQKGQQVVNAGNDLVDMLSSLGVDMPESVQGVLQGIGTVTSSLASIDFTRPFSILTGITGTMKGLGQTIGSIFGLGGADYSGYEEMKSRYDELTDVWDTLISKKMEYIDIDYGPEASKAAEEARQLVDDQIRRQRQLAQMLSESGSSIGSHSLGVRVNKRMGDSDWERLSALIGERVQNMGDVLNLSADVIGNVLHDEKFLSVLTTVNSEFVDYIQNISDYADQLDEIADKEQEALTGISFDSFYSDIISDMSDLSASWTDLCDDFETQLRNSIFSALVSEQYKQRIKNLYDQWGKAAESDNRITDREAEQLRNEYMQIIQDLMKQRDEMAEAFGWQSDTAASGSGQTPTTGALTTMSQDSISRFEGIGRSLQTHLISVDKNVADLRASAQLANETLATISANTAHLVQIHELMEDMKINGIKVQ